MSPRRIPSLAGLTLLALLGPPPGRARVAAQEDTAERVFKQLLPSTVWIFVPKDVTRTGTGVSIAGSTGSGVLVDERKRIVLTNYHVVGDKSEVMVYFPIITDVKKMRALTDRDAYLSSQAQIAGKVVAKETSKDLALVQLAALPPGTRAVKVAMDSPSPGQKLHTIGNPGATGALWSYTSGNVRQVIDKTFTTGGKGEESPFTISATVVMTDSPVNSGDSGGPVVNNRCELVALVQGHRSEGQARLVSIFIDATEIHKFLRKHLAKVAGPPFVADTKKAPDKTEKSDAKSISTSDTPMSKEEEDASSHLRKAKFWLSSGDKKTAKEKLDELIKKYPKTKAADMARELLDELKKP